MPNILNSKQAAVAWWHDTASCSCRDTSRALDVEYHTARSSTKSDLPANGSRKIIPDVIDHDGEQGNTQNASLWNPILLRRGTGEAIPTRTRKSDLGHVCMY